MGETTWGWEVGVYLRGFLSFVAFILVLSSFVAWAIERGVRAEGAVSLGAIVLIVFY